MVGLAILPLHSSVITCRCNSKYMIAVIWGLIHVFSSVRDADWTNLRSASVSIIDKAYLILYMTSACMAHDLTLHHAQQAFLPQGILCFHSAQAHYNNNDLTGLSWFHRRLITANRFEPPRLARQTNSWFEPLREVERAIDRLYWFAVDNNIAWNFTSM